VSLVVLHDAACGVRHAADMGARHGRSRRALRVRRAPMIPQPATRSNR